MLPGNEATINIPSPGTGGVTFRVLLTSMMTIRFLLLLVNRTLMMLLLVMHLQLKQMLLQVM